jgi:lipopolysaccharide transport system permease protein
MVAVVDGFRWMVAPAARVPGTGIALAVGAVAFVLTAGLYFFRRVERTFADVV